jgi:hypothetical protein
MTALPPHPPAPPATAPRRQPATPRACTTATAMLRPLSILLLLLAFALPAKAQQRFQANVDWARTDQSRARQVITNLGTLLGHRVEVGYPGLINTEYPAGSFVEMTGEGGFWLGAVTPAGDTLVTSTLAWAPGPHFWETFPSPAPWDTIWVVPRGVTMDIGDPAAPYWPGYTGVSDEDFVMRYTDFGPESLRKPDHNPLYLEVIQTTYSWSGPRGLDEVLIHTYRIVSTRWDLRDAYFTVWLDPNIGKLDSGGHFLDDRTVYFPDLLMAGAEDAPGGADGDTDSTIGAMLLPPDGTPGRVSFHWGSQPFAPGMIPPTDRRKYAELMSSGVIMQEQIVPTGSHFTLSAGPYSIAQGDTLVFRWAQVFGEGLDRLEENGRLARRLAEQDFAVPGPPPAPPIRVEEVNRGVRLVFEPTAERNPETYTDPNRADGVEYPFAGYRVYKSTVSRNGPWTLLAEYDVAGDGFGAEFGLVHEYTDDLLLNNVEYYYSVTAFSLPDAVLGWPSLESSRSANAVTVVPGTPPPPSVGEVAVVPNPYRGDVAYQSYNPAWERPPPTRERWMEQDRRLQFINLPPRAEVRIYTVSGQLVQTLQHDNPVRGYLDWNLTSSAGQAIASGLYVFAARDLDSGRVQTGKFVVIK